MVISDYLDQEWTFVLHHSYREAGSQVGVPLAFRESIIARIG